MHTHTCACTHAHLYLSHTHTESDTEVRIMDLSEQLWCGMCGRYFILPPGQMSPWLWHLTASSPSVQSTITSQLSPCLPGTGLISQQRWEHIQPARVMHHDGNGGEHLDTGTYSITHSQRLSFHHSPHYHTACTPDRGGGDGAAGGGEREGGYVVLFHPGAPSKRFGTASTVMTLACFHFHQTRKCRGMKGLSLNSQLLD